MILYVDVLDKIATYQKRGGRIVCGNNDYQIKFSFDSEWDDYPKKTVRFIWGGHYTDVDITGDVCPVPVLHDTTEVEVGVYAGELKTTTSAFIGCDRSILCEFAKPSEENDRNYVNEAKVEADRAEAAVAKAEEAAAIAEEAAGRAEIEGGGISVQVDNRLKALEQWKSDKEYVAISITSFYASTSTYERGATVNSVTLNWETNKTPESITLDGSEIEDVTQTSKTLSGLSINMNSSKKSWKLVVTDNRNSADKTASISFLNGIYYGKCTAPTDGEYTSSFIKNAYTDGKFKRSLSNSKVSNFSVTANEGEYIYYCLPTRIGTCIFTVGVLPGGFSLVDTIDFENKSGYKESYYIYRSNNPNLGSQSVKVS